MMKTTWFDIEQEVVNKSLDQEKRGVKVSVKLSPFDVPISANSEFDESKGLLDINFKYFDEDEKLINVPGKTTGVSFVVGKISGRLFGIRIDCAEHMKDGIDEFNCELELHLEKAAHDLLEPRIKRKLRTQSSTAITNVINHYKDKLLESNLKYCSN